jgi:polyhydroxyalkanoate synthase
VAEELEEPALARSSAGTRMARALQPWLDSDVPLAGQLFREMMCNAYWSRDLVRSRLRIGGRVAALENILCPVLNVSGEHDRLVPPEASAALTERVGPALATNVVFPATHLGLLLGAAAHADVWPRIGAWLKGGGATAGD